jgi:protein-tyrosine phosphatase
MTESFHIDNTYTCHNASGRLRQGDEGFADIHCHCLPGLDDGPVTQAQALELCRQMAEDGITAAIATPHQLGRYEGNNHAVQVRQAVYELSELLKQNNIGLTILPGGEVRVDERIGSLLQDDKILTLADGGRYILLEIPHEVFIDIESLIAELSEMGIQSVIAHVERIPHLSLRTEILNRWLSHGCLLQITASSLTGDFGLEFQRNAWQLLCSNLISLIATDAHDTNSRSPQMRAAFGFISENLGPEKARLLCIENPSRIISNRDIIPVSVLNSQEADR